MRYYRKLVNDIRKKSFPEIKGRIWIVEIPFFIPGGLALWILPKISLLTLTNKCKGLSKKSLTGLIAHELSHFSLYQEKRWIQFYPDVMKYIFSRKYGVEIERNADKLAIKKGYGRELIAIKIKAGEICKGTRYEKMSNNYLTVKEAREYMKKLKK